MDRWTPAALYAVLMSDALESGDPASVVATFVDATEELSAEEFVEAYATAIGLDSPPEPEMLREGRLGAAQGLRVLADRPMPAAARSRIVEAVAIIESVA